MTDFSQIILGWQSFYLLTGIAAQFSTPIWCLASSVVIALSVCLQITPGLYGLVAVIICLLGSASVNAWTPLVRGNADA